jgi:hypothetical protein
MKMAFEGILTLENHARRRTMKKLLSRLFTKNSNYNQSYDIHKMPDVLSSSLDENIAYFRAVFHNVSDVVFREMQISALNGAKGFLIFINGMVDKKTIDEHILKPLMQPGAEVVKTSNIMTCLEQGKINVGQIEKERIKEKLITAILSGMAVLLTNGSDQALILNVPGWEKRAISEPMSEKLIRGPKEGFVETFQDNIALIRRRIHDPQLKVRLYELGTRSKTKVALLYIADIAKQEVIDEITNRLDTINYDFVDDPSTVEAFIEDNPYSIFPQLLPTERPDKVAANLMEGRAAIVVDGSPNVLLAPVTVASFFQSPEDYYERFIFGTLVRLMRFFVFSITTTLPALYVAAVSFHHQLIPDRLILTLAVGRILVPFPAFVEAIVMELTIELLREASTRLPGPLGQTIGVVGGLVLGQAAVTAKLASPTMVIVVSLTAIATFTIPVYTFSYPLRLIRFPMMIFAGMFGFFGVFLVWMVLLIHLCTLESFGIPYFSPLSPFKPGEMKDTLVRFPFWAMKKRPSTPGTVDRTRMKHRKGDDPVE